MSEAVYRLRKVSRRREGEAGFLLQVPELVVNAGDKVALAGMSGCGKSTLLDMLAMVLKPDQAAEFSFAPSGAGAFDVAALWRSGRQDSLGRLRMRSIGYVLQTGGLFPFLTVKENIELPRRAANLPRVGRGRELAERLGIDRYLDQKPDKLSVGERQRVAIARAMAHEPAVVLADEPTAALDPITADQIMAAFADLVAENGTTLIVATHDWDRVEHGDFRRVWFDLGQAAGSGVQSVVQMKEAS